MLGLDALGAEAAGLLRAAGIRAPEPKDAGAKDGKKREEAPLAAPDRSPYDVPPLIGAGARPFVPGASAAALPAPLSLAAWLKPYLPPGKEKPEAEDLERADERLRRFAPRGVFARAELDRDAWLAWGLPRELVVWLDASDTLVAEPPVEVVARFADVDALHLGGLLWPEAAGRLARTAYCTREELGRGQVILFLDEPGFRAWTLDTRRLLVHALLYGPGLGTRWSSPW